MIFMDILLSSFVDRGTSILSYENSEVSRVQKQVPYYSVIRINFEASSFSQNICFVRNFNGWNSLLGKPVFT